jgi:(p)ppGpp synthase/HD superfamily hydrolase
METFSILLEYGYTNPVLLKAALIHDLLEDGPKLGLDAFDSIAKLDEDGPAVLKLVEEVSIKTVEGIEEPKAGFVLRIMLQGSQNAKILKLADRISNLSALPLAEDKEFITNYLEETEKYILPYAFSINPAMAAELKERMESTLKKTTQ